MSYKYESTLKIIQLKKTECGQNVPSMVIQKQTTIRSPLSHILQCYNATSAGVKLKLRTKYQSMTKYEIVILSHEHQSEHHLKFARYNNYIIEKSTEELTNDE